MDANNTGLRNLGQGPVPCHALRGVAPKGT